MRFAEFAEDNFGTHPRRPARAGARHPRGHEPVARYKTVKEFAPGVGGDDGNRNIDPLREKIFNVLMKKLANVDYDHRDLSDAAMEVADDIAGESEFVDFNQLPMWVEMVLDKVQGIEEDQDVEEGKKKKKKKSSKSLRGYFFPGYAYYGGDNSGEYGGDGGGGESINRGVAEGSGNWYIRYKGKVLKDKKFNAIPFPSQEAAHSKAMELHSKKRYPLELLKLTQSWMDAPEQGVAEGLDLGRNKYIVTYNQGTGKTYTALVPADDEYEARDRVTQSGGRGTMIQSVKLARGNEPTDREWKVYSSPNNPSASLAGLFDREQGMAKGS